MKKFICTLLLSLVFMGTVAQDLLNMSVDELTKEYNERGSLRAAATLGYKYTYGVGVERDNAKAFQWYYRAAAQGDPVSQYYLAVFYAKGIECTQDIALSVVWLKRSAQQGFATAQSLYGFWLLHGYGNYVKQNIDEGLMWLQRSAKEVPISCFGLADFYESEAHKNVAQSIAWYEKALENKVDYTWSINSDLHSMFCYAYTLYRLSRFYIEGDGVPQDMDKGIELLQEAASYDGSTWQGECSEACAWLGEFYLTDTKHKDEKKGFQYLNTAAERGNARGMYDLSLCYLNGYGTSKNPTKHFEWMQKAAEQGFPQAYNDLAYCYMEGRDTAINKAKAWENLNKALELDSLNPNFIDSKGEFYAIEGNVQKAMETWKELKRVAPNYVTEHGETNFTRYIKGLDDSNIDVAIPQMEPKNTKTFALIIANENYQDLAAVPYATNDGSTFEKYCENTLGIPATNISFVKDATLNNIRRGLNWLKQVLEAYNGEASVIFYYAGHGIPDETGSTSYILPVDGIGNDVNTGYSLGELYKTLSEQPAQHVLVFLDACFSGTNRDGDMLASARGVAIKVKTTAPQGKLVVFSAAQGDETAWPYKEQSHGLFTYYLLKKIKESKGSVTLGDLSDYVCSEVKKQSIVTNKKSQTPAVNASTALGTNWKGWTLK